MDTQLSFFQQLKNFYIKLENAVLILLLSLLVALVFMEVIVRAFDSPTTWSVGVAQLIFMWVIFLGANRGLRNNAHIGIDVIVDLLPKKIQKYTELATTLLSVIFLAMLIYFGFEMTLANTGRIITGTNIGYYTVTLAIPIGASLMFVTAIFKFVHLSKEIKQV